MVYFNRGFNNTLWWLSVRQLATYHSVSMLYNVLMTGTPEYLYDLFQKEDSRQYRTRLADKKQIRLKDDRVPKTEMALKSFKWQALQYYNQLPLAIRIIDFS